MNLHTLLSGLEFESLNGVGDTEVTGISCNSRHVKKGDLFVCIPGFRTDGHNYIQEVCKKGVVAVVVEQRVCCGDGVAVIRVQDSRYALSFLADRFFRFPSKRLKLIGVTGTNGKTTTSYLIEEVFRGHGKKTSCIGTIGYKLKGKQHLTSITTPESLELHRTFSKMLLDGVEVVVLEVSSHALSLKRVEHSQFDIACFTNITRDHLDFHKRWVNYVAAKKRLFHLLSVSQKPKKWAVLNSDDPMHRSIKGEIDVPTITYGLKSGDIRAKDIRLSLDGTSFFVETPLGVEEVKLQLLGLPNVYNALCAISVGVTQGFSLGSILEAIEGLRMVPGRFEVIRVPQREFIVIVDYAHTPDALMRLLKSCREIVGGRGRLILVFGCGGDRDKKKRRMMGRIASSLSDITFITTDNPRGEAPEDIIRMIEAGFDNTAEYSSIVDRREAIGEALDMARRGDIVIIAGKGHETYQEFKDKKVHFDDREVVKELLGNLR
jgi:UDP-N-acetylmuramoyl-L-alanyl-D-glutamate--2,6-diaminopimelate ligase